MNRQKLWVILVFQAFLNLKLLFKLRPQINHIVILTQARKVRMNEYSNQPCVVHSNAFLSHIFIWIAVANCCKHKLRYPDYIHYISLQFYFGWCARVSAKNLIKVSYTQRRRESNVQVAICHRVWTGSSLIKTNERTNEMCSLGIMFLSTILSLPHMLTFSLFLPFLSLIRNTPKIYIRKSAEKKTLARTRRLRNDSVDADEAWGTISILCQ